MALLGRVGGGFQRGRQSLSSPGSGDSSWEVNLANTPETGRYTPINASFAGERRKKKETEVGCQSAVCGGFWSHVYIHVLQDKYGSFKNICINLTLRRVKAD